MFSRIFNSFKTTKPPDKMAVALAMESNPDSMNKYMHKLGVSEKWRMIDVIGLEGEALSWVPRPVLAVILLFPFSEALYENHRAEQEKELLEKGKKAPTDIFHLKQGLSNVCGTIALVHSVANNTDYIEIKDDGLLNKYLKEAKELDSAAKGALLEKSTPILDAYEEIVKAEHPGESPDEDIKSSHHYVTFVHKDGKLYELDGLKSFPIEHGPTTAETFLEDAAKVCREFIEREPNDIGFNLVALVPADK